MSSKTAEFDVPLWLASLDLKKTFDQIKLLPLLQVVSEQGVPDHYTNLLAALYADQTSATRGSRPFPIRRGAKQGDIISPILFNAGLELAFRRWKQRLTTEGWLLDGDGGRLTNTRYADDIMLYANSLPELIHMLGHLTEELAKAGLHLNVKKTKLLTNDARWQHHDTPCFVENYGGMMEVLPNTSAHKYLGRHICGHSQKRGETELNHRTYCASLGQISQAPPDPPEPERANRTSSQTVRLDGDTHIDSVIRHGSAPLDSRPASTA